VITSPFRAAAIEQYARTRHSTVAVRRPAVALLMALWLLLCLALTAGVMWLLVAWPYVAG
jgi:hypothetical protein